MGPMLSSISIQLQTKKKSQLAPLASFFLLFLSPCSLAMAEDRTIKSDTLATIDEKAAQQPGRFLTPQPANNANKKKALQGGLVLCCCLLLLMYFGIDLDYQPTPPPATVTVQNVSATSKDPCWFGW
ncbi:hypothetical protein BJV82DRAFT_613841 [Fennellomyces sp. T-0311]|nr:hypothetical protein BJV82DRAFT_613841 [Fennellomyces sp. T-0311]